MRRRLQRERKRRELAQRARIIAGIGGSLGVTVGFAPAAEALQYQVDNTGDSGAVTACDLGTDNDCSLRQAIDLSNASDAVDDVIVFESGLSGSIDIATGLTIFDAVQINGPGASVLSVDGNDTVGHFYAAPAAGTIGISGLTLTDGFVVGNGAAINNAGSTNAITLAGVTLSSNNAAFAGGAIYSLGPVTITNSQLTGNSTNGGSGGAIEVFGSPADLTINGSTLSGNQALNAFGGAIHAPYMSDVSIASSTISGNTAKTVGGIAVQGGELNVTGSSISGNTATDFDGGGVRAVYSDDVTIQRSTISGNRARARGGGISVEGSRLVLANSTVSGNTAYHPGGATGAGVEIFNQNADEAVTISNSTIARNTGTGAGGGAQFSKLAPAPDPVLVNSIVADNSSPSAPDLSGAWDASFSLVENTAGSTVTSLVPGSNLTGVDPVLDGLAANGGPTRTHRPSFTSPVIDAGSTALGVDQRGRPRPADLPFRPDSAAAGADGADIGAVELMASEALGPPCAGKRATLPARGGKTRGTPAADVIRGTPKRDVIRGLGGADRICGLAGNDRLLGGKGKDRLLGGKGRDVLRGGPARDILRGGPGSDRQRQ